MSKLPQLKDLALRDTPFADLMNKRIFNVLLIATKYDAFMLEDDGRVDEQIFNEYTSLSLRYPPRFTQVTTLDDALAELDDRNFELIIVMPNMDDSDIFAAARHIKRLHPSIPIVVLTPFSREVSKRVAREDLSSIDYVFSWLGNAELLMAIIKLIEDKWNAPSDSASVGVQIILLVEDSIRFYSSALPHLYHFVLEQSQAFSEEALNPHLKTLRMRGRPKVMLARTWEEAAAIFKEYEENMLGIISDMSFTHEGKKDQLAGYSLARYVKSRQPHLPFILSSSDEANVQYADELNLPFISKSSKSYPQDLRREVMSHFGFGDFIIINPATGQEVMRIHNLQDLQRKLPLIPDDSLHYHLEHNHFSRFFFSRAMFPPAVILKKIDIAPGDSVAEARQLIADCIVGYRRMKNAGVVALYQRDRFDHFSRFARIGNGSLGGKGRGLAFMGSMVKRQPHLDAPGLVVDIPRTVVVCTDVFDEFMEQSRLYPLALSDAPDETILQAFLAAPLPSSLMADLEALLDFVPGPVAVRSSSLLEDSHYQPFAGVYATYMVPPASSRWHTAQRLAQAIKAVYASVFRRESKSYLSATQNLIDQEKMAVVLQEVVGTARGHYFYPTLSGVARSLNVYPIGPERPDEGIATIALGLGKYIVDGGQALRFSPAHPHHLLLLDSPRTSLRTTQRNFYALRLDADPLASSTSGVSEPGLEQLQVTHADPAALRLVASSYDPSTDSLRPSLWPGARPVITFAPLLHSGRLPLAKVLSHLLSVERGEMGRHVEMEFALEVGQGQDPARFSLLQLRPIVSGDDGPIEPLDGYSEQACIVKSGHALGSGTITDVNHVVYVRSAGYHASQNPGLALELEAVNRQLTTQGHDYILIGPGRWGSSDPWLGIPVSWAQISGARVVVERALPGYQVEPSQGTHFFQNLTSFSVGYLTASLQPPADHVDEDWLEQMPMVYASEHVRVVRRDEPFVVKIDGRRSQGVVLK